MIYLVYAAGAYLDAVRQVTEEKKCTQIDQAIHLVESKLRKGSATEMQYGYIIWCSINTMAP